VADIEKLRSEINKCDQEIVAAMQRRLAAVRAVGEYKWLNKLAIYQPQREQEIVERIAGMVTDRENTGRIVELFQFIMQQSRNIQMRHCIPKNIVLTGFMACGKTTIGKELARLSGYAFVDTDAEIENLHCRSVQSIFAEQGESTFREYERAVIGDLSERKYCVIACGGGAILDTNNSRNLQRNGIIVWLKLNIETILERLRESSGRPLAEGITADETRSLYHLRSEQYEKTADITIDADGKSISEICVDVLAQCLLL